MISTTHMFLALEEKLRTILVYIFSILSMESEINKGPMN